MTFLNPILAGLGLAAVSIPIIIHLLMRRRRKPVMWAAMRFLLEAYRQHRRRLRLEQFLLLAARCLLIALVALALGRPLLGAAGLLGRGPVSLYLLVDNGLASTAQGEGDAAALQRHRAAAESLLAQLDATAGDRAALIALGGPAQALVLPSSSDAGGVREMVQNLPATASATDLPGALTMVRDELDSQTAKRPGRTLIVILSDFLAGSADTQRKLTELGRREGIAVLASRPAESGAGNISLTGVEPLRPVVLAPRREQAAAPAPVQIKLRRSGPGLSSPTPTTIRLWLETDAGSRGTTRTPVGQTVANWTPGQTELSASATADLSALPTNIASAVLTATIDQDAIAADNTFRRPIEVRRALRVGIISPRAGAGRPGLQQFRPADWFRLALSPAGDTRDAEIETVEIEPANVDATRLAGVDASIVLAPDTLSDAAWKRLRAFADAGGLIVISPPADATVHLWADAMVRELAVPWNLAREARAIPDTVSVSPQRDAAARDTDVLSELAGELPDLVTAVRVFRTLTVEFAGQQRPPVLLQLSDGTPLVLAARPGTRERTENEDMQAEHGRGLIVLLTFAPAFDWTDLQAKPLMVPLTQEVVRQGIGRARGTWSILAGAAPEVPSRTQELRAMTEGAAPALVRVSQEQAVEPVRSAGLWRAMDDRGGTRALVAVNADPTGALGDAQPAATIGTWLAAATGGTEVRWLEGAQSLGTGTGSLSAALDEQNSRNGALVLPLLIGALLLGMLELAMARWFSHATIAPVPATGAAP
jgi:hypothetical protein